MNIVGKHKQDVIDEDNRAGGEVISGPARKWMNIWFEKMCTFGIDVSSQRASWFPENLGELIATGNGISDNSGYWDDFDFGHSDVSDDSKISN